MKKFKIQVFVILISILALNLQAGNININNTFTNDTTFNPFINNSVYGLSFTGEITLNSDTSLVRLILQTQSGTEFMIYEAYPLICSNSSFVVENVSDETKVLDGEIPAGIRLEIINSTVLIKSLNTNETFVQNAISLQNTAKYNSDVSKVGIINDNIGINGFSWIADYNSVVAKFYADKKSKWGEKYNLKGYEYYKHGVFEASGENYANVTSTNYVNYWDWRNRHGANNQQSAYYDGDAQYGSGWLTPAKDQDLCGSCGVFSTIGSLESTINLYYNQQIDFDLSEQQQISCNPMVSCAGGWPFEVFSFIKNNYVVEETCYPYISEDGNCYDVCNDPDTKVSIESVTEHWMDNNLTVSDVQLLLKQNGPLSWVKDGGAHAVTMVGWLYDDAHDKINLIYKENLGTDWGIGGFGIEPAPSSFIYVGVAHNPEFLTNNEPNQLLLDADGDGIDNWGIGQKPPGASNYVDCDDNNPMLGSFSADLSCQCIAQYNSTPISINSPVTWNATQALEQPLVINSGGELTITSTVYIQKDVIIKVKPGGKLIIDGGTLTKACNDLWKGIELIGDKTLPQLPHSNQGYLLIKNNGSINYAQTAVLVGATNPFDGELDYNKSGGIIIARDSKFLNNINDVKFLPYYDSQYQTNESEFRNSSFVTSNDTYIDFFPENHIELNGVYGINIEGCTFKYDLDAQLTSPLADNLGTGILIIDASLNVLPGCVDPNITPCVTTPTSFNNLRYGIRAFNTGSNLLFTVKETEFTGNVAGIYLSGYTHSKIYYNTFNVSTDNINTQNLTNQFTGGVYFDGCTGYIIEENEFYSNFNTGFVSSKTDIGIYVKDSGEDDNEIYNNNFHNLNFPIIAEGINKGLSTGLTIKCNDLTDNLNDIYVVEDPLKQRSTGFIGIKVQQGVFVNNPEMMAGNTFSDWFELIPAYSNYLWNYNNQGENFIYYHHNQGQYDIVKPFDNNYTGSTITLNNPFNIIFNKNSACPSHISSGGSTTTLAVATTNIATYETDMIALTDGGNTDENNDNIEFGTLEDANTITADLIADSPYLSDTVLKSAINKEDVIQNSMLRDILVENPQSAKSEIILDAIDNKVNEMPGYMMNEIMEGKDTIGDKEVLQSKLSYWKNEKARIHNYRINDYMQNLSISLYTDSILDLYQNEEGINSKYKLAITYSDKGDLTSALSTISDISLNNDLKGMELDINNAYDDYFGVLQSMENDTIAPTDLDSSNVSVLINIANSELPMISSYARGLLLKGNYINYSESIYLPTTNKSARIYSNDKIDEADINSGLKLMPNPAKNYLIVEYEFSSGNNNGIIIVRDMLGNLVKSKGLNNTHDQITLDLTDMPSGMYIVSLYSANKLIDSKQLSKIK